MLPSVDGLVRKNVALVSIWLIAFQATRCVRRPR